MPSRALQQYYHYSSYTPSPPPERDGRPALSPAGVAGIIAAVSVVYTALWTIALIGHRRSRADELATRWGIRPEDVQFRCGSRSWWIGLCCFHLVCLCPVDEPDAEEMSRVAAAVHRVMPPTFMPPAVQMIARGTPAAAAGGFPPPPPSPAAPHYFAHAASPSAGGAKNPLYAGGGGGASQGAPKTTRGDAVAAEWFASIDADRDGYITGAEARAFFLKSQVPSDALARIWASTGAKARAGHLDAAEFAHMFAAVKAARAVAADENPFL
jgi:hypothetical protein